MTLTATQSASIFAAILFSVGTIAPRAIAQRRPRASGFAARARSPQVVLPTIQIRVSVQHEAELIMAVAPDALVAPFGEPVTIVPASRLQLIASYDGTPTAVLVRVNSGMGILRNYDDVAPSTTPAEIAIDCIVEPPARRGSTVVLAALAVAGRTTR